MAKALTGSGVKDDLVIIEDGEHSLLRPIRLTLRRKLTEFLVADLDPAQPKGSGAKTP
jgi:hypothetical protein